MFDSDCKATNHKWITQGFSSQTAQNGRFFVEKQEYLTENSYYDEICTKNGIEEMKATLVPTKYKTIEVEKGLYEITPFGKMFLMACVR